MASVGATVSGLRRFSGAARLRYLGPRPLIEDASVESKRSVLVNMETGYEIARRTRIVLDVLNLFDSHDSDIDYFYRSRLPGEPAEGVDDIHTHPLQPRTARLSVRFEF